MYNLHQEHHFEAAICNHLGENGWLYAEGDAAGYLCALCVKSSGFPGA
jgi:type I restriction enzyme R subunit